MEIPWDVTALHISRSFLNTDAINVLPDHNGSDITKSLPCLNSSGRLPLHWAAAGPGSFECWLPDEEIRNRIINTLELLLAGHPGSDINARDNQGATPLHYAISKHFDAVVKFLLEIRGDAAVGDINNRTVLHQLAARYMDGEPIDRALIDILLSHGANINQQDNNGNTALHLMTRNLRHDPDLHEYMVMGAILPRQTSNESSMPTLADGIRGLDEMVAVLLEAAGGDSIMDQPNAAGKKP
ncbi:hypothetical protein N7467_004574 [Penicillium canescens]|nr:hypothetical protein N7467_004574 [Penicillium canescens]